MTKEQIKLIFCSLKFIIVMSTTVMLGSKVEWEIGNPLADEYSSLTTALDMESYKR